MPLRPLPYRLVKKKLLTAGFVEIGQVGSHVKFGKQIEEGVRTTVVPNNMESAYPNPL